MKSLRHATYLLLGIALTVLPFRALAGTAAEERETREIQFAADIFLWAFVVGHSAEVGSGCDEKRVDCGATAVAAELSLLVLSSKRSPDSLTKLASLVRYTLDGSLSESFSCHVVAKGKPMLTELRSLRPAVLLKDCESAVTREKTKATGRLDDVTTQAVCATIDQMQARVGELISAIRAGRRCPDEDF